MKLARLRYNQHKARVAYRGIGWEFTFASWVLFWGDDFERRGTAKDELGMQRFHDRGPYSPENCIKDVPARNAKTRGNCTRWRNSQERRAEHQRELDQALMHLYPPRDDLNEDELELARMFNMRRSFSWNNNV